MSRVESLTSYSPRPGTWSSKNGGHEMSRFTVKKFLPSRDRIEKPLGRVKAKYVNFQKLQLRLFREVSSYPHFKDWENVLFELGSGRLFNCRRKVWSVLGWHHIIIYSTCRLQERQKIVSKVSSVVQMVASSNATSLEDIELVTSVLNQVTQKPEEMTADSAVRARTSSIQFDPS